MIIEAKIEIYNKIFDIFIKQYGKVVENYKYMKSCINHPELTDKEKAEQLCKGILIGIQLDISIAKTQKEISEAFKEVFNGKDGNME